MIPKLSLPLRPSLAMQRILQFALILLLSMACGNAPQPKETVVEKANEDDLLARLPMQLISNPTTQKEIDQNLIINYAIDELLNVQKHESGIYYQILEKGQGGHPEKGDFIEVNYKGSFLDGKVFDSNYKKGKPSYFNLWEMIEGWQIAIPMLETGGKGLFLIPSHLAYGEAGLGNAVPPNSVLRFEIELVKFGSIDE